MHLLDFEKPVVDLDAKIEELRHMSSNEKINILEEITNLQKKRDKLLHQLYAKITPWQKVQVARHPERPHYLDYVKVLIEDFVPLAGDRLYKEDEAIIGGLGRFAGQSVMVIGQEKGHDLETRMKHNFGMPRPEGYRKAQRLMRLADHYQIPVISFVDTAGAYPGLGAEERGQAEAIARSMDVGLGLKVPYVSLIIGEGGSGGAIAIATANEIFMLEHAVYAVISPEGCASILWRSADKKEIAAEAQKLTAQDLFKLKIIDGIIEEPLGGAHRDHGVVMKRTRDVLTDALKKLSKYSGDQLKSQRRSKFLSMGHKVS